MLRVPLYKKLQFLVQIEPFKHLSAQNNWVRLFFCFTFFYESDLRISAAEKIKAIKRIYIFSTLNMGYF